MDLAHTYSMAISALGALAILMFCQLLVADVVGLRSRHIPGSAVPADHENPLFRASRTVANTNESIAIFILAILFCMLCGAPASATAYAAWAFVVARCLYAVCYYLNLQILRSVMFGISLLALTALLVLGGSAWL
ncbi:MAPEG family protein [Halioglobus maricola]|uniref:MAPEG family protein n=1 Tax=Halioglobus maricola TaxID=2601894 RepID=A0A5P9NHZ5_9GAMM|nr:MAPEG family protein [Halioglobus maricola]QFU75155.1 MAPEG family protein [Halioglobus maricola]